MSERPIIFSGEMVRAILDGRKTQTRRVIKPQPETGTIGWNWRLGEDGPVQMSSWLRADEFSAELSKYCPYGDQLWVREQWATIAHYDALAPSEIPKGESRWPMTYYAAWTGAARESKNRGRWRHSIHMPRWASRIQLEITNVKAQELQSISEDDAHAEGIPRRRGPYILDFAQRWDQMNAKRGHSWASNPWVWAVEFKVINP